MIVPPSDIKPTKDTAEATTVIGLMGLSTGCKISTTVYYLVYRNRQVRNVMKLGKTEKWIRKLVNNEKSSAGHNKYVFKEKLRYPCRLSLILILWHSEEYLGKSNKTCGFNTFRVQFSTF